MKDFNEGVRHGDPHTSSKPSVTLLLFPPPSESCRQDNIAPAESVEENSPDVPSVPHGTQEELQEPRATSLKLTAEGKAYECECERVRLPLCVPPKPFQQWPRRRREPIQMTRPTTR